MRPFQLQAKVISPLLFSSYLFGTEHPFLSHIFLRNLEQAIASPPLGPHIVRNYTFNLAPHGHSAAGFFCDDRRGQLKIQWIQTESR